MGKFSFSSKTSRQIFPIFIFGVVERGAGGEPVATGLCTGYAFNGPVQNCRQLSRNLLGPLLLHYKIEKKKKEREKTLEINKVPSKPVLFFTCFVSNFFRNLKK